MATRALMESMSDEELMAEFQDGDIDSLSFLIKRLLPQLGAFARKLSPNRELADDALQEALQTMFKKADSFRGDSKVLTWMYVIVRNASIDIDRKEKVRTKLNVSEEVLYEQASGSSDFADVADSQIAIRAALMALPDELRDPMILVFLNELSVDEAAKILGIPPGTVKSRCSRAKGELAKILAELDPRTPNQKSPRSV